MNKTINATILIATIEEATTKSSQYTAMVVVFDRRSTVFVRDKTQTQPKRSLEQGSSSVNLLAALAALEDAQSVARGGSGQDARRKHALDRSLRYLRFGCCCDSPHFYSLTLF